MALLAFIRFLIRMDVQVICQTTFLRKTLITLTTLIGLHTLVDRQMCFWMASLPK